MAICENVKSGGLDPSRLAQTSPYGAGGPGVVAGGGQRNSWIENARGSIIELTSSTTEVDSASSSPGVQRVCKNDLVILMLMGWQSLPSRMTISIHSRSNKRLFT